MSWTDTIEKEMEGNYRAAEGLFKMVDKDKLNWKPATGSNWMTTGQLMQHITEACGMCCKGFVTGDWGMPADAPAESMLPPAEKMASVKSVDDALQKLAADKKTAFEMVKKVGEKNLATQMVAAPWNPEERPIGHQFLQMAGHLGTHKAQLFYYLKLQGKPVHTGTLYGM
jgi:hypothetical protein